MLENQERSEVTERGGGCWGDLKLKEVEEKRQMMDLTPPRGLDILAGKVDRCHRLPIKQRNKVFIVDEMKIHTLLPWCCQSELSGAERTGPLKCVSHRRLARFKVIWLLVLRCLSG